jgi:hypothetical protein
MYGSKILYRIKLDCFLKFVVHELNSEMVKFEMVVPSGREKADVDGLYPRISIFYFQVLCCILLLECWWMRGTDKADMAWVRVRYSQATTGTSLTPSGRHPHHCQVVPMVGLRRWQGREGAAWCPGGGDGVCCPIALGAMRGRSLTKRVWNLLIEKPNVIHYSCLHTYQPLFMFCQSIAWKNRVFFFDSTCILQHALDKYNH